MAIDKNRASLSQRLRQHWVIWISGLSVLMCLSAIIMGCLFLQIDKAREHQQQESILGFNFVLQVDHNIAALADALINYLVAAPEDRHALQENYIQRYDILHSAILYTNTKWRDGLKHLPNTGLFIEKANAFLHRYDPLMVPEYSLQQPEALQIYQDSSELSARVYAIGLQLFEHKSILRDKVEQRMDTLHKTFWGVALTYFVFLTTSILFLLITQARSTRLHKQNAQNQAELNAAREALTIGDLERRDQVHLVASASHDLRQPLNALSLYLNTLSLHVSSPKGKIILEGMNRSTKVLNQQIKSLQEMSRIDAGDVTVNEEYLAIDTLFDQLHQCFAPIANERNLALDIKHCGLYVQSDNQLLERILSNLIANALKYTEHGSVTVSAFCQDQRVCICISDTGLGIPLHEQQAIFNEYYQLEHPTNGYTTGQGLGLSIVKRLTKLLNIELSLSSVENQGTRFELWLPLPLRDMPQSLCERERAPC